MGQIKVESPAGAGVRPLRESAQQSLKMRGWRPLRQGHGFVILSSAGAMGGEPRRMTGRRSLSNSTKGRLLEALPRILKEACAAQTGFVLALLKFRWLRAGTWFGLPNQTSRSLGPWNTPLFFSAQESASPSAVALASTLHPTEG